MQQGSPGPFGAVTLGSGGLSGDAPAGGFLLWRRRFAVSIAGVASAARGVREESGIGRPALE
jgi:hypothetical protein